MDDASETEEQGIACALGKICSLESRLRDAIQSTHSLHRSFGSDWGAVDRERTALLEIREHLEGLEDKLREYKAAISDPKMSDEKAIALSQMDAYRKALLRESRDKVDEVLFNKDVVKDILAFADTGAGDEALPDVGHEMHPGKPGSGSASPRSSQGTEITAYTGEFSEAGSYLTNSNSASPTYASKKDLASRLFGCEGQENHYPYSLSASTPNFRNPQQGMEHPFHDVGGFRSHSFSEPSRANRYRQYDLGSEMVAASHASQREFAGLKSRARHSAWSEDDSFLSSRTGFHACGVPPSYQGSCDNLISAVPSTGTSDSAQDMLYGGKLSFSARAADLLKHPVMPASPIPKSEPPRVLNDPTYSEGSNRTEKTSSEDDKPGSLGLQEAVSAIQPNRVALERRAASLRSQEATTEGRLGMLRHFVAGLVTFVMWPMHLGDGLDWCSNLRVLSACITGGASALVLTKALCSEGRFVPRTVHRPQRRPKRKQMRLRADGKLVPDWMHRSQFKATDSPPLGALTPTAGPPEGEMFPVIPPPSSRYIKG